LRALVAALHRFAQLCAICVVPHCVWFGGFGHGLDRLGHLAGLKTLR
jgi:hypothetical protein